METSERINFTPAQLANKRFPTLQDAAVFFEEQGHVVTQLPETNSILSSTPDRLPLARFVEGEGFVLTQYGISAIAQP